jgi:hypothetical protein
MMQRSFFGRAFTVGAVMLLFVATGSQALAVKPIDQSLEVNITDVFPICAFPVQYHEEGTVRVSLRVDQSGEPRFDVAHVNLAITWTNLSNGNSLTGVQRVGAKTHYGGDVILTEFHGLVYRFIVPGHGTVLLNAGHFFFDRSTGTVSLVRGNLTFLDGDYQDLCSVLAGD